MLSRRIICVSLVIAGIGVAVGVSSRIFSKPPHVTPYTIEFRTRMIKAEDGETMNRVEIVALRSDGSEAQMRYGENGQPAMGIVALTTDNCIVTISHKQKMKSTEYNPPPITSFAANVDIDFDESCVKRRTPNQKMVGRGTYMGLEVVKHEGSIPTGATLSHTEAWLAPACGCQALYKKLEIRHPDGSFDQIVETIATNISFDEPDARIFEIPTTYVEVPPSKIGAPARTDERYYKSQNYKLSRQQ